MICVARPMPARIVLRVDGRTFQACTSRVGSYSRALNACGDGGGGARGVAEFVDEFVVVVGVHVVLVWGLALLARAPILHFHTASAVPRASLVSAVSPTPIHISQYYVVSDRAPS